MANRSSACDRGGAGLKARVRRQGSMIIELFSMHGKIQKLKAAFQQLPRLLSMRARKTERCARENFLTKFHNDHFGLLRRREATQRAVVHWFLKGTPEYQAKSAVGAEELLAHVHAYIQSGSSQYLKRAEQRWAGTLAIEHDGSLNDAAFWLEGAPASVRLLEKRNVA
jgi:hypothetical protein